MQSTLAALGIGAAAASVSSVAGTATAAAASSSTAVSGTMLAAGGVATGTAPTSAGVAGSAGALGAAGAGAKVASTGVMATITKLTAAGVAGGLLTFGVLGQVMEPPPEPSSPPSESAPPRVVQRVEITPPTPVISDEATVEVAEEVKPIPRVVPRKGIAPSEPEPSALEREVAMIDAARAAVAQGEGSRALTILADHSRQFPKGRLVPEAEYLRMQARSASGDAKGARNAARELLERHPSGPHSARARELLESGNDPVKE